MTARRPDTAICASELANDMPCASQLLQPTAEVGVRGSNLEAVSLLGLVRRIAIVPLSWRSITSQDKDSLKDELARRDDPAGLFLTR